MECIATADWHFGCKTHGVIEGNKLNSRINEVYVNAKTIIDYANKNSVPHIIIAGDIFDNNTPATLLTYYLMLIFKEYNGQVWYITGNHDYVSNGLSPAAILNELPNFTYFHQPKVISIEDWNIVFYPHCNYDEVIEYQTEDNKKNVLVSHTSYPALEIGSEKLCLAPSPREISIDPKPFDLVINGHIHKPQYVGNIISPGSIMKISMTEAADQKVFYHIKSLDQIFTVPIETRPLIDLTITSMEDIKQCDLQNAIVRVTAGVDCNRQNIIDTLREKGVHSIVSVQSEEDSKINGDDTLEFNHQDIFEKSLEICPENYRSKVRQKINKHLSVGR